MQVLARVLMLTAISLLMITIQATHLDKATIEERTHPVGQVHVAPSAAEVEAAAAEAAASKAEPRSGESIYGSLCVACHGTGLANAPIAGDSAIWATLLEAGMDSLISSAKQGKNVMPPMGNCADCTDDELRSTIEYMSELKN